MDEPWALAQLLGIRRFTPPSARLLKVPLLRYEALLEGKDTHPVVGSCERFATV
jgi:hypothetical protein